LRMLRRSACSKHERSRDQMLPSRLPFERGMVGYALFVSAMPISYPSLSRLFYFHRVQICSLCKLKSLIPCRGVSITNIHPKQWIAYAWALLSPFLLLQKKRTIEEPECLMKKSLKDNIKIDVTRMIWFEWWCGHE
jgi:hypothetical protein